jgi:hypothetical protein
MPNGRPFWNNFAEDSHFQHYPSGAETEAYFARFPETRRIKRR